MEWMDFVESIGPDNMIEVPDANTFYNNRRTFEEYGFTIETMSRLMGLVESQLWSVLALFRLVQQTPENAALAEIGSARGGSMATMMVARPNATFISIDPFVPYVEETHAGTGKNGFTIAQFKKNIDPFGIPVRHIMEPSQEAYDKIEDGSLDLLYIDGNHSYGDCRAEVHLYRPKIKPGGILCGHDYHPRFPGVIRAVKEVFGPGGYTVMPNSSVWVAT